MTQQVSGAQRHHVHATPCRQLASSGRCQSSAPRLQAICKAFQDAVCGSRVYQLPDMIGKCQHGLPTDALLL